MKWQEAKKQLLTNNEIMNHYEKVDLVYEIGKMVSDARIARNLTQAHLARLVGTKQPSIARIEKGSYLPSLSFLQKIADALKTQLLPPRFEFMTTHRTFSQFVDITKELDIYKDYFIFDDARIMQSNTWSLKPASVSQSRQYVFNKEMSYER